MHVRMTNPARSEGRSQIKTLRRDLTVARVPTKGGTLKRGRPMLEKQNAAARLIQGLVLESQRKSAVADG